jgi:hypothetical protein
VISCALWLPMDVSDYLPDCYGCTHSYQQLEPPNISCLIKKNHGPHVLYLQVGLMSNWALIDTGICNSLQDTHMAPNASISSIKTTDGLFTCTSTECVATRNWESR